jgi:hypothetical protein
MELTKSIARQLCGTFSNVYPAMLENIDGKKYPVYYDGVEMKPLIPVDNKCGFIYVRELGEAGFDSVDLGGCNKTMFVKSNFRLVYYSKDETSVFGTIQKIHNTLSDGFNFTMKGMVQNPNELLKMEYENKKNLVFKNITYFAVDFSVRMEINSCDFKVC